ncbi:RecX: predicted regulatory protein [Desulfosarcina variabilis str. Montpellier]|uniref:regulatory protein RecX n=1 Tax=Desulfosarcina variabilis TaxID=2300 RepID=UPI003AFA051F
MRNKPHQKNRQQRTTFGQSALDIAFRLLTRRDHTRWELAGKLRHKGFGAGDVDRAIARLDELGYLDDAKTARIMADHLLRKGYGILRIRYSLGQKGLDDDAIDKALRCCGDDMAQVQHARCVLEKKRFRLQREADPVKRYQRAYRFLAGRGFPAGIIRQTIGECDDDFM